MIRSLLALGMGSAIGLGLIYQDSDNQEAQEEKEQEVVAVVEADEVFIEDEELSDDVRKNIKYQIQSAADGKKVVVVELATKLADVVAEEAELSQTLGAKHPRILQLKAQIDGIQKTIEGLEAIDMGEMHFQARQAPNVAIESLKQLRVDPRLRAGYNMSLNGDATELRILGGPGQFGAWHVAPAAVAGKLAKYRTKWDAASDEEREEMRQEIKTDMGEAFDKDLDRRQKELEKIEQKFKRMKELLEHRANNRDEILDNQLHELELKWSDIKVNAFQSHDDPGAVFMFNGDMPSLPGLPGFKGINVQRVESSER